MFFGLIRRRSKHASMRTDVFKDIIHSVAAKVEKLTDTDPPADVPTAEKPVAKKEDGGANMAPPSSDATT